MHYYTVVALLLCCTWSQAAAQRFPERFISMNPLGARQADVAEGEWRWMASVQGWGGFAHYPASSDPEHAWQQTLGAWVELLRIGNSASLTFAGNIEFVANPDNDINFNPRAVMWEEGLFYSWLSGESVWQVGYFHRCKHDVDNLDYGIQRSLIYGSFSGKLLHPLRMLHPDSTDAMLSLRLDVFSARLDDETPDREEERPRNFNRLLGAMGAALHLRGKLPPKQLGWYAHARGGLSLFSDKEGFGNRFTSIAGAHVNGGAEIGISIEGGAHFQIGLGWEYLSDIEILPGTVHSHLLSLGFRVLNPAAAW